VEEALDPPADPEDEVNAIGFGTFLDRVPQNGIKPLATIVDIDTLKKQGFMVEAYTSGTTSWNEWTDAARTAMPNFMSAQTVTWSGGTSTSGTWTYSPIRYWPSSSSSWSNVHFFAYTPSPNTHTTVTFVSAGATDENPKLHYITQTNYSSHIDLIVDAKYNARGDLSSKVKFEFDHVLSRIGFQAKLKNDYAPTTIAIRSLAFVYNHLHISGTYTFNSSTVTGSNKEFKNWSTIGASTTTGANTLFNSIATLTDEKPYNLTEHYDTPRYLMLIPQENAFEQAYLQVSYIITYPPGTTPPTTQINTVQVFLPPITWKPGKAYTYMLNIAPKAVEIDVNKVEDWKDWKDNPIPIVVP
jgi:hypothetical protein